MEPPQSIEERLSDLETRMTTVERFREEMHTGHVMIVTELTERIEESKRYARMLHEEALARIAVIGEGLAANTVGLSDVREGLAGNGEGLANVGEGLANVREGLANVREGLANVREELADIRAGLVANTEGLRANREGLSANVAGLKALDEKVDRIDTRLSGAIDASRAETRAMFEQVFTRLDALTATPNRRRSKKP